jgi:hypothetical protein
MRFTHFLHAGSLAWDFRVFGWKKDVEERETEEGEREYGPLLPGAISMHCLAAHFRVVWIRRWLSHWNCCLQWCTSYPCNMGRLGGGQGQGNRLIN